MKLVDAFIEPHAISQVVFHPVRQDLVSEEAVLAIKNHWWWLQVPITLNPATKPGFQVKLNPGTPKRKLKPKELVLASVLRAMFGVDKGHLVGWCCHEMGVKMSCPGYQESRC